MSKAEEILNFLEERYPDARCQLNYRTDYELLFAVMLSAQATDKSVNQVTEKLFERYPDLNAFAKANPDEIERIVHSVGLGKSKAKNIVLTAQILMNRYGGKVPESKEALTSLPGVGRKTANVVRIEGFRIPEIPVDTHVERVAKRLQLADEKDTPFQVEEKLREAIPEERWIRSHHQLIFFGRDLCKSRNPFCGSCALQAHCLYARQSKEKE